MFPAYEVMDDVAAFMNDVMKDQYTYEAVMPYLNIAQSDLQTKMKLNNIPVTNSSQDSIVVLAGTTELTLSDLPDGLVEIQRLWERLNGSTIDFTPLSRMEFLPPFTTQIDMLLYWAWIGQEVKLIGATNDVELRIDFVKNVFVTITDKDDVIEVIDSKPYLSYRTAALCAMFIAENETRAGVLDGEANSKFDDLLGTSTKARQAISTKRRPYRAAYKSRFGAW